MTMPIDKNLHKMSTAPFCSNFMLCTVVVKVNCSFVGGGYNVKGEKKAFSERHSGRKIIKE